MHARLLILTDCSVPVTLLHTKYRSRRTFRTSIRSSLARLSSKCKFESKALRGPNYTLIHFTRGWYLSHLDRRPANALARLRSLTRAFTVREVNEFPVYKLDIEPHWIVAQVCYKNRIALLRQSHELAQVVT